MMVCVFLPLLLTILLTKTSALLSSSGTEQAASCPPKWHLFGKRCFAFYPVWSSWSTADLMCSQTGGNLASLHTPEERHFVHQLASTHTPVWLGGYQAQQNGSWFWRDGSPFRITSWDNLRLGKTGDGEACMQMEPKSGELHGGHCGEIRFYICSTRTSSELFSKSREPVQPGILPTVSLYDVMWVYSDSLVEEILHSSSFLEKLRSGHMTQSCYASFMQQEALYLQRVGSTLEVLVSSLQEADGMRSLLLDTLKHYSSRNHSLPASPLPQWLHFSLQSFHLVVLEEPVYWLVALAARACFRNFLSRELILPERRTGNLLLYQEWSEETLKEVAWTRSYRRLIEDYQDQMDVFKAINVFREHMMNQKSFYKAVDCDVGEEKR